MIEDGTQSYPEWALCPACLLQGRAWPAAGSGKALLAVKQGLQTLKSALPRPSYEERVRRDLVYGKRDGSFNRVCKRGDI